MAVDLAYQFTISKAALRNVPTQERKFLFAASHCLNEVCMLQKLLAMQANCLVQHQPEQSLQAQQAMLLLRLLAGKIVEAWNTTSHWFGPIAPTIEPSLERETIAGLVRLRHYFADRSNFLRTTRDRFAFHNSTDAIEAEFDALPDDSSFHAVVGSASGNTFMGFADEAAGYALLRMAEAESPQQALEFLLDKVTSVSADFVRFVTDSVGFILAKHASEPFRMTEENKIDLSRQPRLNEVHLPFLFRIPVAPDSQASLS
jgi:hypothetical protein